MGGTRPIKRLGYLNRYKTPVLIGKRCPVFDWVYQTQNTSLFSLELQSQDNIIIIYLVAPCW